MRYVVTPGVAIALTDDEVTVRNDVSLVAPTLLRSQMLAELYRRVRDGDLTTDDAAARLDTFRSLKPRLLGDRVLQSVAWQLAHELGWADTYDAEYLALTRLQADALVTDDERLAQAAAGIVEVASLDDLLA